jgi:lysophospholipase L1-like esterase
MASPEKPLSILHLGDSYTCAEGIDPKDGWPAQWHARLAGQGTHIACTRVLAQTGRTCGELLAALREAALQPEWDWITLCIGVNNQYRSLDIPTFRLELEQLIVEAGQLLANPPHGLFLLSIPDWSVSPFAADRDPPRIAREIDAFNAAARLVATKTRMPFLDWTPLTRRFAGQPGAFAPDGLHPSARQYAAWADFLTHSKLGC